MVHHILMEVTGTKVLEKAASLHSEPNDPTTYAAFLIRLWRDENEGPWRVSVYDPHNGERWNFASLRQFFHFLETRTGERLSSD